MSTAELLKPILESGIRSIKFFNGRLLSGEDMSQEQLAIREARKLIGQAVGDGVAYGLEVAMTAGAGTAARITVQPGLALNRCGEPLRLNSAADLSLVRPQNGSPAAVSSFSQCTPFQAGTYVAGSGVYLLVISPAQGTEGRAPVSGLGNDPVDCNTKYTVDGVQFRLIQIDLTATELNDQNHLRSLVAYKCFGIAQLKSLTTAPFSSTPETYGLLDQLRPNRLTDCDVPLAVLLWSATEGIKFVDAWAVRRRLIEPSPADEWNLDVGDRRRSEADATLLQFQDQLEAIQIAAALGGTPSGQIEGDQYFTFLPPAGFLPTGANGFDWKMFLGPHAPDQHTLIDEGLFRSVIHRSLFQDPIKVNPFAVAIQPNTAPPIPVSVYRLPGASDFVLFARSWNGRIRVFLNPVPAANEAADINASSKTCNAQFNAAVVTGAMRPVVDVPPGPYKVNGSVQGYQTIAPVGVNVIGGETIDVAFAIVKLPNGNIVVTVTDQNGASISNKVSSVTAVSGPAGTARNGVLTSGKWSLADLPPGSYDVTVAAAGFRPSTLTGVTVALGENVQRTVVMVQATDDRPLLCIAIIGVKKPPLQKARLCLVLTAGKATTLGQKTRSARKKASNSGQVFREDFEVESKRATEITNIGGPPWAKMVQLDPVSPEVGKWLADWQHWFNKQYPGQGIGSAKPAIFIDPRYISPKGILEVADAPQAYAVFGKFYRPMTVNTSTNTTNRPLQTKKAKIRGIGDDDWDLLDRFGIKYVDQVAGLWSEYISNITGQSPDFSRYLILDSISAVDNANKSRTYYEGWDADVDTVLKEMGLTDDVAIANADRAELSKRLGAGFANRLIEQSHEIVPVEAWSLESIGFSRRQMAALADKGISSKGELVGSTATDDGKAKVGEIVGIEAGQIVLARDSAILEMTAASVGFAPVRELTALSGVNAAVAERLGAADVTSTDALAASDKSELAAKSGLSEDVAESLIESAKGAERGRLDVGSLAPISAADAEALKTSLGIHTVADLAGKDASAIASAFGGDLNKANAVIAGARAGLGMIRR